MSGSSFFAHGRLIHRQYRHGVKISRDQAGSDRTVLVAPGDMPAGGRLWRRTLLRTRWLTARDDLGAVLEAAVVDAAPIRDGDMLLAVAEKAAIVTSGRVVPLDSIGVGRLARLLARAVRPVGDSRGLSVPAKMQYVLDHAGRLRVLVAAAASALSRPFGAAGVFYRVVGPLARDLDGARGAYAASLLPPLTEAEATLLAHHLEVRLGLPVAIVDINDRGGSIRGCSTGCPDAAVLTTLLSDNPLGDRAQSTPAILLSRPG